MKSMNDESEVLERYRSESFYKVIHIGRFFHCYRILRLTKSILFPLIWKDSSSKASLPPDFHCNHHHIMMEVMRVDDCVNKIDCKNIDNSFAKENKYINMMFGKENKNKIDCKFYFNPDTRDSTRFNFKGYISNFERVLMKHSNKIEEYKKNYPKCKTMVFFICDESNNYIQVLNKEDLKREDESHPLLDFKAHVYCFDSKFIDIIKKCQADYVIWYGYFKELYVNGKVFRMPRVCIFDVKHLKYEGIEYNHNLMYKVKEEVRDERI